MADKKLNEVPVVSDIVTIFGKRSNGEIVQIDKSNLATLLGELIGVATAKKDGLMPMEGRGALPHGGERGAGLSDGAVRQAGLLHRQGCAHVPDQRRGAPLLRPHQRAGCVPAEPHRGDVGQRRGHHRRGGRVRNAGLGQGSA